VIGRHDSESDGKEAEAEPSKGERQLFDRYRGHDLVGTLTLRIFLSIAMLSLDWVELVTHLRMCLRRRCWLYPVARQVTSQLLRGSNT